MHDFERLNASLEAGDVVALYAIADILEEQGNAKGIEAAQDYRWLADSN